MNLYAIGTEFDRVELRRSDEPLTKSVSGFIINRRKTYQFTFEGGKSAGYITNDDAKEILRLIICKGGCVKVPAPLHKRLLRRARRGASV